ncbi:MAG TPA: hypothetical protein VMT10_08765 [Solirubrobacteraceae bacterium]|nr:hypothetical protein [Solirubrobacteraceae bacterium]
MRPSDHATGSRTMGVAIAVAASTLCVLLLMPAPGLAGRSPVKTSGEYDGLTDQRIPDVSNLVYLKVAADGRHLQHTQISPVMNCDVVLAIRDPPAMQTDTISRSGTFAGSCSAPTGAVKITWKGQFTSKGATGTATATTRLAGGGTCKRTEHFTAKWFKHTPHVRGRAPYTWADLS